MLADTTVSRHRLIAAFRLLASSPCRARSNVARAFSMAGAFALVRFRSAPGSAKDISIVFFTMAAGLACGLGYVTFAAAATVISPAKILEHKTINPKIIFFIS